MDTVSSLHVGIHNNDPTFQQLFLKFVTIFVFVIDRSFIQKNLTILRSYQKFSQKDYLLEYKQGFQISRPNFLSVQGKGWQDKYLAV